MSDRIRTSTHTTKFLNKNKRDNLSVFIDEYRRISQIILDDIWDNGYEWIYDNKSLRFSIKENQLGFPKFIDYKRFNVQTFLSARALSTLTNQLSGIIKSSVEKQRKRLFILEKMKTENKSKSQRKSLIKKIKQNIPQKPNCGSINPEISSRCCDWKNTEKEFDGVLRLKSITKNKIEIKIPIKFHKHSKKLAKNGEKLNSYLISKNNIQIRWKQPLPEKRETGIIVGADQGIKTVLTFSNNQASLITDCHGHSLESILKKLCRKKKGSKAFQRTTKQRNNFINWSINQLNLEGIKELRLEKIWNIGFKSKTSRFLSHWTNTIIRDKVESVCEENGVHLIHQSSTYRSQRCSNCGNVRKANRKGKIYNCKHCGFIIDADLNASLNHVVDLPEIPYVFRKLQMNRGNGFYWLETGFFEFGTRRSLESLLQVEE